MLHKLTLGVVCLAGKTHDAEAAAGLFAAMQVALPRDFGEQWVFVPNPVVEPEGARLAADFLRGYDLDGLILISGTLHPGNLALEIVRELQAPVLLWALPELPPVEGKARLNSLGGLTLDASNLYKGGRRDYRACFGKEIDRAWLDSLRISGALRRARVALAGNPAYGRFNLEPDKLTFWRELGLLADHHELKDIYSHPVKKEAIAWSREELKRVFDTSRITPGQLDKTAELSARMAAFMIDGELDALALRCRPELTLEFGISPCAALSLLQGEGLIISCDADLGGAVSMLAHRSLGSENPFLAEFSNVDFNRDTALLWRCGSAPCSLGTDGAPCTLESGPDGGAGVTANFVLPPGAVSLLRFDTAGNQVRVFLARAEVKQAERVLNGTYAEAVFPGGAKQVLRSMIENGVPHQVSLAYGECLEPFELLAKRKGWQIIGS